MRNRHAAAAALLALGLAAFGTTRCDGAAAQTVDQFMRNPARLEEKLRRCQRDPGGEGQSPACRNAHSARLGLTAERLRRGGQDPDGGGAWVRRRRQPPAQEPVPVFVPPKVRSL